MFFQILQIFERTFTVLGEKVFSRDIKFENCSLCLKWSIKKSNFLKFSFFQILQKFERTFTVLGEKHFGRGIKIENCSLRLKISIKKQNFWKYCFFSNSSGFWTNLHRVGEKNFGRDIKIENCSLRLNRSIKKPNFWKFWFFFSNSSGFWTNSHRAWRKSFRQGYQNWKLQSSFQKINQKTILLKVLFFFQILQNFERTFTVLGEKVSGSDINIEKCSFRLIRSIKGSNFWKFSFFSNSSELRTNSYRARRKTFWQGYQNWKLQSSSQKINQKIKFLKVLFFFKFFRTLNEQLPCSAKNLFGRDIKIENCSLRLIRSNKKSNFWEFSFISNSLELWTNIHPACWKSFVQGYQKWKLYFMSSEYHVGDKNDTLNFLKVL